MAHIIFGLVAACSALAATAYAQPSIAPAAEPFARKGEPASSYGSAWSGYRPFADEKIISWKEANDEVRRIGGWRAYLRERQNEPPSAKQGEPPQTSPREPPRSAGHHSHNASKE